MDKFTVKLGLSHITPRALLEKGRNVHDSILLNPAYPTLQPLLPDLATACDVLEDANKAMEFNGGKVSTNNKRIAEKALRSMLKDFGGYVQGISGGDKTLILSAAFDVVKGPTPLPPPEAPADLRVTRSAVAGLLKVRWKKMYGAVLYYLEMREEGTVVWERVHTTTRISYEKVDLVTGKEYSFRVQSVASSGISPMSEEVTQKAA
ncbi:MAG: fibronectin type III domain-containing protein [Flavobacteriales bacterium]|nr:fibronectin type III domain-containing protein [Flavobacteriales bacterium]